MNVTRKNLVGITRKDATSSWPSLGTRIWIIWPRTTGKKSLLGLDVPERLARINGDVKYFLLSFITSRQSFFNNK
jgi:hypothetical protein